MDTIREQKLEALKTAEEYLGKLIPAMEEVISEIKGDMKEDTVDYLLQIIDGFNFMIETYNVTRDIVNDPEPLINDDQLEITVGKLPRCSIHSDIRCHPHRSYVITRNFIYKYML